MLNCEFIPEIGKGYDFMYRLCKDRGIKISGAFSGRKFMGLCISDEDGDAIIKEFRAASNNGFNSTPPNGAAS